MSLFLTNQSVLFQHFSLCKNSLMRPIQYILLSAHTSAVTNEGIFNAIIVS